MRWLIFALAAAAVGPACRRAEAPPPEWLVDHIAELDSGLRRVDPANGIDAQEAEAIAGVYMLEHLAVACGVPGEATLVDQTWIVALRLGVAGQRSDKTIAVDAKTGAVWSDRGPRYRDFVSFRYTILAAEARRGY